MLQALYEISYRKLRKSTYFTFEHFKIRKINSMCQKQIQLCFQNYSSEFWILIPIIFRSLKYKLCLILLQLINQLCWILIKDVSSRDFKRESTMLSTCVYIQRSEATSRKPTSAYAINAMQLMVNNGQTEIVKKH